MKESCVFDMRSFQDKSAFLGAPGVTPGIRDISYLCVHTRHPFEDKTYHKVLVTERITFRLTKGR
jgi:hypothetical protein